AMQFEFGIQVNVGDTKGTSADFEAFTFCPNRYRTFAADTSPIASVCERPSEIHAKLTGGRLPEMAVWKIGPPLSGPLPSAKPPLTGWNMPSCLLAPPEGPGGSNGPSC